MAFGEIQAQFMSEMEAEVRDGAKHAQLISLLTRIAESYESSNEMLSTSIRGNIDPIHDQLMLCIEQNRKVTMIIGALTVREGFVRLVNHGVVHLQHDTGLMSYVRVKEIQAISEGVAEVKSGRQED